MQKESMILEHWENCSLKIHRINLCCHYLVKTRLLSSSSGCVFVFFYTGALYTMVSQCFSVCEPSVTLPELVKWWWKKWYKEKMRKKEVTINSCKVLQEHTHKFTYIWQLPYHSTVLITTSLLGIPLLEFFF